MSDQPTDRSAAESAPLEGNAHPWYDDDFCKGGGMLVGDEKTQVACPVCGEMMDVDGEGRLFKHRPRIPKNA
jgi:hypothetical protein